MATLYWHNLNTNNDATDRSNYTTDQIGATPAADLAVDPSTVDNLVAWYDAADLGLADGAAVATWPDKSGNGYDLTQATAGFRPIYNATDGSVVFDGVDDYLGIASLMGLSGNPDVTILAVVDLIDPGTTDVRIWQYHGALGGPSLSGCYGGGYSATSFSAQFNGGNEVYDLGGNSFGSRRIVAWQRLPSDNTTDGEFFQNGAEILALSGSGTGPNLSDPTFSLGGGKSNDGLETFAGGKIHEFIVLNKQATQLRRRLEGYLAWKWGLQAGLTSPDGYNVVLPRVRSAFAFDGTGDAISLGQPVTINYTAANTFALSVWYKRDTVTATGTLLSRRSTAATQFQIFVGASPAGSPGIRFGDKSLIAGAGFDDTDWHHVLVNYDGTTLELFVDGVSQGTETAITAASVPYDVLIGARRDVDNTDLTDAFAGLIAQVATFSATQDAAYLYNDGRYRDLTGLTGLQHWIPLSIDANDTIGALTGTVLGDATIYHLNSALNEWFDPVRITDDLRFDGAGVGSDDNWIVPSAGSLTCNSVTSVDFGGDHNVPADATVTIADFLSLEATGGNAALWLGTLTVNRITQLNRSFSSSSNRCNVTLTGNEITRSNGAPGNSVLTLAVNLTLTQETTITSEGLDSDNRLEIDGSIVGLQKIIKAGTKELRLKLVSNGRTSQVSAIDIAAGVVFVSDDANAGSIIQGIGGAGGEPSACLITLTGNDTTLQYGCANNGNVEWGNPLTVAPLISGARLLFQGTGNEAVHSCYFPIVLNSDLKISRGAYIDGVVMLLGPIGWAGTGTVAADSGKITGAGRLTIERPSGAVGSLDVRLDYPSGARAEHTGGTLITSPTQSFLASCGYRGFTGAITLSFGTSTVEVNRNARFWNAGADTNTRTITNDILLSGNFTGDKGIPTLSLKRVSGNPTTIFSGVVTVDCPAFLVDTGSGGNAQQHQFAGGVTLLRDTRIVFSGENGQDLVLSSDIAGAFSLYLAALVSGSNIKFSFTQTVPRTYVVESGAGYGISILTTDALKTATSIEVLAGGRLWYEQGGEIPLDGQLLMREGSFVGFANTVIYLKLNGVGPHEWSCSLVDPALARLTEIRLPTAGTVIEFNPASSPLPTPMWRITGGATFQTANPTTTSIRPGQDGNGTLPSGVSTVFVERGKTLTVNSPLILSLYRSNVECTGVAGIATISGTGRLVFSEPNGWSVPSFYGLAEFNINVSFAGTDANTSYTVSGLVGLKDVRTESSTVNLAVTFHDVTVGGDFYAFTSIAGGVGNTVIRWSGTNVIEGTYYQRQDQMSPSGLHRTEILSGANLTVKGDFRPCSDMSGGLGQPNPASMEVFAEDAWTLTLKGDLYYRGAQLTVDELFYPLNGMGYVTIGKLILDATDNAIAVSDNYAGIVADVELHNRSGIPRTVSTSSGAWWNNATLFVGDNLTLTLSNDTYGLNVATTGINNTLVFGSYAEVGYSWNWKFPGFPASGGVDLRGFANVDTSASTFLGIYPASATEYWLNGAAFATLDLYSYAMSAPTTFRDDVTVERLQPQAALGADIRIEGVVTARDVVTATWAGASGATWTVTGTLIVTNELDLRSALSSNPSYDVRILGNVEYRPRGAGILRILDFGGAAAGIPDLTVRREAAVFPADEAMYGVSLAVYPLTQGGNLLVRNESATQHLQFILGAEVEFVAVTTEQASTGPVTLDFNGQDLRTPVANFHPGLGIVAPVGSSLVMVSNGVPATLLGPLSALPEVHHRAVDGLTLLGDLVTTAYLQTYAGVGPFNPGGFDVTASGIVAILEGSVDLVGLVGSRFTADLFTVAGVDMNPAGTWFVDSTQAPVATLMTLANSNASGSGARGNAISAINAGNNVNWDFGLYLLVPVSRASLGIGLGLGLTNE